MLRKNRAPPKGKKGKKSAFSPEGDTAKTIAKTPEATAASGHSVQDDIEPICELVFTDSDSDQNILSTRESLRVLESQSAATRQLSQWVSFLNSGTAYSNQHGNGGKPTEPSSDENATIKIDYDDISEEVDYWSSAIVCHVLGASPPLEIFGGFAKRVWGKWGISKIASVGKGIYIVRFDSITNKDRVLENGFCMFDSKPMIMESWSPDLDVQSRTITHVPIWVQFPKLDLKYWGTRSLSKLASLIGDFIKLDRATLEKDKLNYARVLVNVQIKDSLPDSISFLNEKDILIKEEVMFEWKLVVCTNCKNFGHLEEECRRREGVVRRWVAKPRNQVDYDVFQVPNRTAHHNHVSQPVDVQTSNSFEPLLDQYDKIVDPADKEIENGAVINSVGYSNEVEPAHLESEQDDAVVDSNGDKPKQQEDNMARGVTSPSGHG